MAQRISWLEPSETTITKVEINRSSTLYGTYTVVDTIDATSDGETKTSANTWVVNYTDTSGIKSYWYKTRFYDDTSELYSEYSDPTTSEELIRLCTVAEVKGIIDTVGRWSDDTIFKKITETDDMIYIDFGTPLQASYFSVGKLDDTIQDIYYLGEEDIYRVDRVFYGTTTKTELFLDDAYKTNTRFGMIKILPVASSGVTLDTACDIEAQYVPKIYNKLSLYRTCEALLEETDTTSGGKTSKELEVMSKKVKSVERIAGNMFIPHKSSDFQFYDPIYGVNRRKITQNLDRNIYIGTYGWD